MIKHTNVSCGAAGMRCLLLILTLVASCTTTQQESASLVITGARVWTGDAEQPWAEAVASKRFLHLGAIRWQYGWNGYLALTRDHLPVIHRHSDGLYAGIGCNGRGVAMATVIGELLADLLSGSRESGCAIPIRPGRRMAKFHLRYPGIAVAVIANRMLDNAERRICRS